MVQMTIHPPGTVGAQAGRRHGHGASGHGACAARSGWQSGTLRDYDQGLGIRGQLLDWPGQGPVPGPGTITARNPRPEAPASGRKLRHPIPAKSDFGVPNSPHPGHIGNPDFPGPIPGHWQIGNRGRKPGNFPDPGHIGNQLR